jgi:hypothetical protein
MPIKPLDCGIIFAALCVVVAAFFLVYANSGDTGRILLKCGGGEWVFPLDATETVNVSGPLGNTVIEIRGGSACFASSPCLNQTCVAAGSICLPGQWAACLPNRVMLFIGEGDAKNEVDAAAW